MHDIKHIEVYFADNFWRVAMVRRDDARWPDARWPGRFGSSDKNEMIKHGQHMATFWGVPLVVTEERS